VSELGERVPMNERARAEQPSSQVRELAKANSSDVARLRQLTSDLQQVGYGLSSAASQSRQYRRPEAGQTPRAAMM
jgi:molecular chaperone DnaK